MAAALVLGCHGDCLRLVAAKLGYHPQGLAAASAFLRRRGCVDRRLLRRLAALDAAAAVVRHVTVVSCEELRGDLERACADVAGSAQLVGAACDVTTKWGTAPNHAQGGTEAVPTEASDMVESVAEEVDMPNNNIEYQEETQVEATVETDQVPAVVSYIGDKEQQVHLGQGLGACVDTVIQVEATEEADQALGNKEALLAKWKARMAGRPGFGGTDVESYQEASGVLNRELGVHALRPSLPRHERSS